MPKRNTEFKELSNRISTLTDLEEGNLTVCIYLFFRLCIRFFLTAWYLNLATIFYPERYLLYKFFDNLYDKSYERFQKIIDLAVYCECNFPYI